MSFDGWKKFVDYSLRFLLLVSSKRVDQSHDFRSAFVEFRFEFLAFQPFEFQLLVQLFDFP